MHNGRLNLDSLLVAALASPCLVLFADGFHHFGDSNEIGQVQQQSGSIKSRSSEVIVPVTVLNQDGEPVFDLIEGDFGIYDDGIERQIERCDVGGDSVSITLLVETSSKVQGLLAAMRRLGIIFTQQVMTSS